MLLYRVNYCASWTIVSNKLLYKLTVLPANEHKENKSIDNQSDSCYFIMVNSAKHSHKKNHLACDHTMREVLTTLNNNYYNNILPNTYSNIEEGSVRHPEDIKIFSG